MLQPQGQAFSLGLANNLHPARVAVFGRSTGVLETILRTPKLATPLH